MARKPKKTTGMKLVDGVLMPLSPADIAQREADAATPVPVLAPQEDRLVRVVEKMIKDKKISDAEAPAYRDLLK